MNHEIAHLELFSHAMDYYGIEEVPGEKNNPKILEFFKATGHMWVQSDETAWCSAFVNYLAKMNGYEYSGELDARSWLRVGEDITRTPTVGDIVVLWREHISSWKGHVGLFVRQSENAIYVLGGNQSNQVKISPYPIDQLLSYRMLRKI